jgi:hypothetical protein
MILKELISERASIVKVVSQPLRSKKHLFDALIFEYSIALKMNPDAAFPAVDHFVVQIFIQLVIDQCYFWLWILSLLLWIGFLKDLIWPEALAYCA